MQNPVFAPGRAPANGPRKVASIRYDHHIQLEENISDHQQKLAKAGCFVMITNTAKDKMSAREVLKTYKEQYGVEKNFSFLKEPPIQELQGSRKNSQSGSLKDGKFFDCSSMT